MESQDKKVEIKPEKKEEFIPIQLPDGSIQHVKPDEAYRLAVYGLQKLKQENEPKKESTELVEEDTDTKLARVEKELIELRDEKKRDGELASINRVLWDASQQSEITKSNSKIAAKINALSLARVNINPRLDLKQVYKEELTDYIEMVKGSIEQEKNANGKVRAAMSGALRSGGMPSLDTEKKYKAEDIKTGASRRALEDWLEKAKAEGI